MDDIRLMVRAYLWADDGLQIYASVDPDPESQLNLVKADLGDDTTPGITVVDPAPVEVTDRNGKAWSYTLVDLWMKQWIAERRGFI